VKTSPQSPQIAPVMGKNGQSFGDTEPHWWRINPQSGTFGGREVAEYLAMTAGAALSTYLF